MSTEKSYIHNVLSEEFLLKTRNNSNQNLVEHFRLVGLNRFRWTNLPNNIESEYLEKFLFDHGQLAFYDDPNMGLIALPCINSKNLNVYGEPIKLQLHSYGGEMYNQIVSVEDCVRIKANDTCKPMNEYVRHYSNLLTEIESIWYQNLRQQRFPYIVGTTKNTELTLKNIFNKLETGEEVIYVDEKLSMSKDPSIAVLKTEAPFLLDKLQQAKYDIKCELYTLLGINNTNFEKKERMLVDEINVSNGQILLNLELEFKQREKGAEEVNKKYGTNIKVEKVIEHIQVDFLGGVKDGTIHNGTQTAGGDNKHI